MKFPKKCIVDTNVPKIANRATASDPIPADLAGCVSVCIDAIQHVVSTNNCLVLDAGDEIYTEYGRNLSRSGQPGVGDLFMKWVHDNRWKLPDANRVEIHKNGDSYEEFPKDFELAKFDPSDRKFVAVAQKCMLNPAILQAADRKWWYFKEALQKKGIKVHFLCPEYAKTIIAKNNIRKARKRTK